jgi:prenyltransferase beta subunit
MHKRIIVVSVVLLALLASVVSALAGADTDAALAYLRSQQNADGGFGSGFSPDSAVGSTADAVLAIIAAEGDPRNFDQGGNTPLTYLAANAASVANGGDLAKLILALIAAGENPRDFGGVDSVAGLEAMIDPGGKIGGESDIFVSHTLAVLALRSAQRPIPPAAVAYIEAAQQANGAWAWDGSVETAADTNSTAFALEALIAAGVDPRSAPVAEALAYYAELQNDDGGWPYQNPSQHGTATDSNSTAVTIQALIAAGQDPSGGEWTTSGGQTPLMALEGFQNESGAFAWQEAVPEDNLLATVQALPALMGKTLPFATMDAGPAPSGEQPAPMPVTMPETGGTVVLPALSLMLVGLALLGGGHALRGRK